MILRLPILLLLASNALASDPKAPVAACQMPSHDTFRDELWPKVIATSCLTCHRAGGDAEGSRLVLLDPRKDANPQAAILKNRETLSAVARLQDKEDSRLLLKASGRIKHGGNDVLKVDSTAYRLLEGFVRRVHKPGSPELSKVDARAVEFFDRIVMVDDARLLRRLTLQLCGRLPTPAEITAVRKNGLNAIPDLLDAILWEDAFYDRLREAFNDIFLTTGYGDGAESALSYEHFRTRHWTTYGDFPYKDKAKDAKELQQLRYKVADDYRKALLGEPMKLIEHIVRNDRPFTEILTADYIMVSPYTARGYGIYEEIRDRFCDPHDPFEYIPVKLKALVGRHKSQDQESATGFYPHAGILSTFQYLRRYPTTETNRNRLRARMFYQHFLGVDVLELAARVSDAAAVTAKYEIPTMQAAECVVCHRTLDPVASLFQDYYSFEGVYGRCKEGWYKDMFQAGFEGADMPPAERWRSLQWLGEQTIRDPRFAVAMVEHGYYLMTGRRPLLPPKDADDPLYEGRWRAYQAQRCEIETIARTFAEQGFQFKTVIKMLAVSRFYRADGVAAVVRDPVRRAELEDLGVVRLLSPEQVERKVQAIFGTPWGRLNDQLALLYGGIDAKEVTERASDPSGAMGSIMRMLSNDVACRHTLRDFARPRAERRLFTEVEPADLPEASEDAIRRQIVVLHQRILGKQDDPKSADVERTYKLFTGILAGMKGKRFDPQETYACRTGVENAPKDPDYCIRAWRAVVTYLLRRPEFLYE